MEELEKNTSAKENENPEKTSPEEKQHLDLRQEKMNQLFEKIETKVAIIKNIKAKIDSITNDASYDDTERIFNSVLEEARSSFQKDDVEKSQRVFEIKKKLDILSDEHEKLFLKSFSDSSVEESLEKINRDMEELMSEKEAICTAEALNNDFSFLYEITNWLHALLAQRKTVVDIDGNKEEVIRVLIDEREKWQNKIPREKVVDIYTKPFEIGLIIDADFFEEFEGSGIDGVHMSGTPFTYISNNARVKETIEHESEHAILTGLSNFNVATSSNPDRIIDSCFRTILEKNINPLTKKPFQEKPEKIEKKKQVFLSLSGKSIVDMLHEEILAEYMVENTEKKKRINLLVSSINEIITPTEEIFSYLCEEFATAGHSLAVSVEEIQKNRDKVSDPLLKKHLDTLDIEIVDTFINVIKTISFVDKTAMNIGKDVSMEMNILFHLFPPSKFGHVRSFLGHKYKKEIETYLLERISKKEK